jgi:hypothetical protein
MLLCGPLRLLEEIVNEMAGRPRQPTLRSRPLVVKATIWSATERWGLFCSFNRNFLGQALRDHTPGAILIVEARNVPIRHHWCRSRRCRLGLHLGPAKQGTVRSPLSPEAWHNRRGIGSGPTAGFLCVRPHLCAQTCSRPHSVVWLALLASQPDRQDLTRPVGTQVHRWG